jgi:alcohol dehydrogenase
MRTTAAILYEMEKPLPYASSLPLQLEEVELEGPGPGEALIEVAAAGLCHSDLSTIDGSRPRPMPMILGHEASGIVREIGPGVREFQPDDHVVFSYVPMCGRCLPCATGRPALCENGTRANMAGTLLSGARRFKNALGAPLHHHLGVSAFSQFTVVAQESLVKIDSSFPLEKAALFGCAILTGVGAVVNTAKVEPGQSVAVFGLGGVGLSVIMGARVAGAYPIIAVDVLEDKLALAKQIGASHTVNARIEEPVQTLKELSGGGTEYVFEATGIDRVFAQAYESTRRGGMTIFIGLPHPQKQFSAPAVTIVSEERTIKGSFMGSAIPRRDVPKFMKMYCAGLLPIDRLITRMITLSEINAGFDALARGEAVRQVVSLIDTSAGNLA